MRRVSPKILPDTADTVFTSREAAAALGVSISTAQTWMENGMIPSWKTPGGHRRTHKSAILSLLSIQDQAINSGDHKQWAKSYLEKSYPLTTEDEERSEFVGRVASRTHTNGSFEKLSRLAADALDCPIGLVSFLTVDRQLFKGRYGISFEETPRSWAFCNYTVVQPDALVVEDASADSRFRHNPLVSSDPYVRFYAGVRIQYENIIFGALCVMHSEPRKLRSNEKRTLLDLGHLADDILTLHIKCS